MQGSKLYVGNLSYTVSNEQLQQLFTNHGTVNSVNVISGKGFGFVEMSSPAEAEAAKNALNGTEFQGRTLKIDEARPPQKREGYGGFGGGNRDRNFNDSGRRGYGNRY